MGVNIPLLGKGLAYSESFSSLAKLWGWISLLSPGTCITNLPSSVLHGPKTLLQSTSALLILDLVVRKSFVPGVLVVGHSLVPVNNGYLLDRCLYYFQDGLQVRVQRMEKELELLTADFRAWLDWGGGPSETIRLPPPLTPAHIIKLLGKVTLQRLDELRNMLPFESLERVQADIAAIQQMHEERTEPALRAVGCNTKMLLQKVKEMESAVERLTDEQKQLLTALALLEEQLSQTRLELQAARAANKDMDSSIVK
ncbi:uncharacterized protein LOC116975799 [Amblyraja radiata]|uniref:uncharacterized protein LOC116975799 n=1 Tax=Amblyraja radiata TaxID=386614 RepID=UPI001401EAF0|nr:uncharacterized protein LOC116975799 [Amblyraja radiata]